MHDSLSRRVGILALVEMVVIAFLGLSTLVTIPQDRAVNFSLAVVAFILACGLYFARSSKWAKPAVIMNFLLLITINAAIDPLGSELSGTTWSLFILWVPFAMLVIRDFFWIVIIGIYNVVLFVTIALLEISQVIPLTLLLDPERLYLMLTIVVLVLIALMIVTLVINYQQIRSYNQLQVTTETLRQKELIIQQTNADLATNNQELQQILHEQQNLNQQIQQLEGSLIRLRKDIFLLPLVGGLNNQRLEAISERIMQRLHRERATYLIIDMTSAIITDQATFMVLTDMIGAIKLLGCTVIVSGLTPEVVREMVLSDVNLEVFGNTGQLEQLLDVRI